MEYRADVMMKREELRMQRTAFTFETDIGPDGKLELNVPLAPGTHVEVMILAPERNGFEDLVAAAASSTAFWDNPMDDEDWNNA